MAASVIGRATWTDDDGTGTTGTILNNARLQADVYDKVDAMFAGTGSYTTFTFGGILSADGGLSGRIKNFNEDISTLTISSNAITLDLSVANDFKVSLTANITTITVSNWTASKSTPVVLRLTQDGTGGRTVTLPAGWKWSGGTAPTITATANKTDIILLYSDDGGTTIFASMFTQNA
jgi:hypothetical protein